MITDGLLNFVGSILHAVLSVIPAVPVPGWLSGGSSAVGQVLGYVGSMGVWFPGPLALTVIGALLAVWLVGYGVHIARMVISLFSGGGGGA
jgi:hypothetical protein